MGPDTVYPGHKMGGGRKGVGGGKRDRKGHTEQTDRLHDRYTGFKYSFKDEYIE